MARWALLLIFCTLLFANTAWLEEASDIEGSGDDVDYADGDDENVSNGSSIEEMSWSGRRATPKIPPRQRIWKAIRREVRDMKNFLPTLANNISFMELDVRDMNRNFFSMAGDVRFIKNEVMYIKRQGHIIWENVTDTRRDHKRMNKTLWWILGNVTQVIEDVDKTSMAITSIGTSYGSLAVQLEKAVSQISDAQTLSNDFQNMRLEVTQLKTSMEYGSTKMTEEIDIIRDMVSHLSHDIVGMRQIFAEGFSHVDHHVNSAKSRILANVSAIDAKVRSHGGLLNSITDNVANIGSNLAGFSGRINDVWDLMTHIGGHMDQFDTRMLKVGDQMTGVHDNVGQVNALISNVGYKVQDVGRQLSDMEHHMGAVGTQFIGFLGSVNDNFIKVNVHLEDVHNKIISNVSRVRGDLDEMKEQLRDIRQVIADKCEGACPNGQPSSGISNGAVPPHLIDAQDTVTTAKPGMQPPDFPSNGVDVQNGEDFQTDPAHRPNGHPPMYPPTYPSTTVPAYPYPPSSTSPFPPVHIPTSTFIPTPMPVYPHPSVPTSPYPPAHLPTSTHAPISLPGYPPEHPSPAVQLPNGYPSEYPSNGKPPVPPFLPTTASPLPPGYPNGYPSNGQPPVPPFLPTTASPLPPGYPNGYPTEYPSNGQPPVPPFLPTTASPLPPGYPNGYPTEYPSNGHPPVPPFFPTTVTPLPPGYPNGYPTEYPSNGHPPVPPFFPTTVTPLPPGYPNGYPTEYPSNGQPPVPPFLPTTVTPLPPGYPNGYPTEYPSNGQPPVPPFLPTTVTPLPPGYPNGYPTEYPSNGQPPVTPFFPTTVTPLPPGYPNGYPSEHPSNGQPPVPPFFPPSVSPLPPGYPNGYPTEYPSNGKPPVPPFFPTTVTPLPPGYPNGYPTEYPSNGQTPAPPFFPTTVTPLPPGYPNGYPTEYPSNGQPPVPPFFPTTVTPFPPGYPNGYPTEYPSNGQPPVPPYLPTTGSPPPPPYPPQPVPPDQPRPSVPQVHPPVHPRPTIPVIYPHLPEIQIPVSPSHPEVPSGNGESLPIGVPQGPSGRGLPIGCGDEFTGYCACLCPCDCTCPVFNPTQSSIKRTKYERFPYMRKKCQCLCACRCRSSAIFDSRPMTPALQPSPDEAHVPQFQPPPVPNIPSTTHSPLIPNGESPKPVVTSPKPPSTETASEFERPGGVSTTEEPGEETDYEEKPLDCCSQLREYFADEISWVLEAFGYDLEQKMRKLREELYSFFDGVVRFHVDVSDLANDLKSQLSIAAANIVGILNAVASRVYSLPTHNSPSDDSWFGSEARDNQYSPVLPPGRPTAHRPPMNPPEFIPPGQTPSHLPNTPNARPQGRPQLSNPQFLPNRPTSRPQLPPGRPTERPNVNMHEARPSPRPPGRPPGGPPGRPLGGLPARPLGGPPGRPPPARPQGAQPQEGPPGRPLGGPANRPQGGSSTRPHGRPLPNSYGRPSRRPQHQGQSSSHSSDRPPRRPPTELAQNTPATLPSKPNIPWTQSRKLDNETITTTTELSEYSSNARRYFSVDDTSEKETTIANTSPVKNKKNKKNKGCAIRRKKIGARSDSARSTEIGDKELALANIDNENDYENYDDLGHEGDSYDVDVVPKGPFEVPGTELAIPDEDLDMVGTPIDQFTFHKMLQEHINEQMMKAVQPEPDYRPTGNRFPLSPWRGRPRNRYKSRPRPSFPMVPGFPLIPPPMGLRPPIPPIGIAIPRIPIPNPLAIRPPPMPDIFGSLPPGAMVAGINGSPYSVSYNDGRGNSWNVNVNRRNYPVTSGTRADEWNVSEEELESQDEDAHQEIGDEVEEGPEQDNDSDEDEINEPTQHAETNEEPR